MILIVGLGNPGLRYSNTRHNMGFMCIDAVAHHFGFPEFMEKHSSLIATRILNNEKIILQKPQTFMNLSGIAVQQLISFYRIPTESVFVIHDDIDLKSLNIKIKFAGRDGGHNGIRNIDAAVGKNYWRIRIGIGRPVEKIEINDYVVSKFFTDELHEFHQLFQKIAENIEDLIFAPGDKAEAIKKLI
ncbi:MAG: aminoacyl-tRNA hydrolase [Holosporales bacterium]|jgi:PTH1 family peptidyl-tRNA hydrolase|nr:aminoacyl-tRNA hydrolase [Holosporales bacterium]